MRIVCVATLSIVAAASFGLAQAPAPQPGEEYQKLMVFAGTWKGEGDIRATPFSAAGKATLTNTCTPYPGGWNVVCDLTGTFAGQPYRELQVMGYDPETRRYTWYDIDNTGLNSLGYGSFEDSTWTFVFDFTIGGKKVQTKNVFVLLSATTARATGEVSVDGGPWLQAGEVKLEKVK